MTTTDDRTTPPASPSATDGRVRTELAITGMTCGACSSRIERKMGRLDGVEVSVNLTTGRARVEHGEERPVAELLALVEKLGFGAQDVTPAPTAAPTVPPEPAVPAARRAPDDTGVPEVTAPSAAPTAPAAPAAPAAPSQAPVPDDDREIAELRHRALVCLAMSVPVVAVSMVPAWQFSYWQWFSLVLAAPVVVWGGWPFHASAARHLRHGSVTMDTLVSLGSLAALIWSLGALFIGEAGLGGVRHNLYLIPRPDFYGGDRTIYLETAAAIVTAVLIGRWLERRGRRRALVEGGFDPTAVGGAPTPDAWLRVGGRELRVPVDNLAVGDEVAVPPGATVPCDGTVLAGTSSVDARAMTGESVPTEAGPGTRVLAGTHNGAGRLVLRATHVGESTQWARMSRRVADAQVGKAAVQRLADRICAWFVPAVIALALYTLLFWWLAEGPDLAAAAAMAVLVVACPCALGLATPTALAVATARGAHLGILLRGPQTLETTRRVDTVVLDKTGTLTTGDMTTHSSTLAEHTDPCVLWRALDALEHDLEHPVARALATTARTHLPAGEHAQLPVADRIQHDGLGVSGTVHGLPVLIGRRLLHEQHHVLIDAHLERAEQAARAQGHTTILVAWADQPETQPDQQQPRARAVLAVGDTVRPTTAAGISAIRAMGLRPVLLTGDNPTVAAHVAAQVGIDPDDVIADVLPTDKADTITALQAQGHVVAMVGDGINDAAALAAADLGLAMGAGSAAAIDAADLTLVGNDIGHVTDALRLARRTLATIRTNLFWAFAYNTAALPLAALGLLNPMIAGIAMGASSIVVVTNSLRLRRFTLRTARREADRVA